MGWGNRFSAAALAAAGVAWVAKAGLILITGRQPPYLYEIGLILCAVGVFWFFVQLHDRHGLAARAGPAISGVGLAATVAAIAYALMPGAIVSAGSWVFPLSLLLLISFAGIFIGQLLLGITFFRSGAATPGWWRAVPLIAWLTSLFLWVTALIHVELPILITGLAWVATAWAVWSSVPEPRIALQAQS